MTSRTRHRYPVRSHDNRYCAEIDVELLVLVTVPYRLIFRLEFGTMNARAEAGCDHPFGVTCTGFQLHLTYQKGPFDLRLEQLKLRVREYPGNLFSRLSQKIVKSGELTLCFEP